MPSDNPKMPRNPRRYDGSGSGYPISTAKPKRGLARLKRDKLKLPKDLRDSRRR